ncbi:elongation factor-like GTPase 1 isoform X5 [Rhipicephalus sanguineus]|uniref:elongation factor-like GTPase 1 isoform X5 n=1 Tax=Rhipicephalus sanguineus TaxID=34632 RepID=UPI0020C2D3EC|nr:elongation factor-like GTPase 1 isoform X5 [Rhipicephalus sanguineus]
MKRISIERIRELQQRTQNIRNICILAHVDHGKTTLADSLVASNGIISQKLAGKLRYLDSRKDEQERGITMKSSAITLYYPKRDLLVNLIDSPGHVDFTSEVMAAVRLCDGAVIVVDVVEGVCAQTKVALNLAWSENLKPMLVLNKIDRLILEKKMTPLDAYIHLQQILEQVNAVVGELFATDVLEKTSNEISTDSSTEKSDDALVFDWTSGLDDADDSTLYFSPEQGNVVFASAFDGWGFSTSQFAQLYAEKLGMKKQVLEKTLWGDYYLNAKAKRILKGAQAKCKKPLFAQLILENLWEVYDAVCCRRDKVAMEKIVKSLGVTLTARDARHNDPRVQLQALCSQWLPLADAFLEMTTLIPSPAELPEARVEALMCPPSRSFDSLPEETRQLRKAFLDCSPCDEAPVIVCISKMVAVETKQLPENRTRLLSLEEITQRREQARQRHAERMALAAVDPASTPDGQKNGDAAAVPEEDASQERDEDDSTFIAFGRVFSGTLKRGQQVYVLGPKHDPAKFLEKAMTVDSARRLKDLGPEEHVTVATIEKLYLLMGRELEQLECVPAGNILGIGGLEEHVVRTATLSSCTACAPFADMRGPVTPILRVALEPRRLADMAALVRGLKLLHQADPCVQVLLQETGEHVLLTAGEVHLERCLNDLTERFAKVEINVSDPIVPFRETIVEPPKVDMVNEVIEDKNTIQKAPKDEEDDSVAEDGTVTICTPNRQVTIKLRAEPLPEEVTELLEKQTSLIRDYDQALSSRSQKLPESLSKNIAELQKTLAKAFADAGWPEGTMNQIWSVGPRRCGPNVLLNRIPRFKRASVFQEGLQHGASARQEEGDVDIAGIEPLQHGDIDNNSDSLVGLELQGQSKKIYKDGGGGGGEKEDNSHSFKCAARGSTPSGVKTLADYDHSFVSGFQLATLTGPLCQEPMMGVAFVVDQWDLDMSVEDPGTYGPLSGQIISAVKEGCRRAFQAQPQRLLCAMYSCTIQATSDALRKMYAVLGRRHGRVLGGDLREGSQMFEVTAVLPVVESMQFANEIRKQTSGLANPQLVFSHWELVDVDPFWVPSTEEEYAHFGEKADTENRARKYMNAVRRRKGLPVSENVVEHAEKQRTLSKKK